MYSFKNDFACARCASMFRCVSLSSFISTETTLGYLLPGTETRLCRFIFNIVTATSLFGHFSAGTSKTSTFHLSCEPFCFTHWLFYAILTERLAAFLQTCPLVECWQLQCHVGLLQRGSNVILTVRSRVWAETFIEVRGLADVHYHWWRETSDSRSRLPNSNNVLPYRSNGLLSFCYAHIKSKHI